MSFPWLWNALFFLMLLMIGVSSEIAYVEAFTSLVGDCFPKAKKKKWLITLLSCIGCFVVGILMTTHSGWFWFNLFDEFTASTCVCLIAFIEVVILSFYGWKQIKADMEEMRGETKCKGCCSWIGPRSPIFGIFWATVCPLLTIEKLYYDTGFTPTGDRNEISQSESQIAGDIIHTS